MAQAFTISTILLFLPATCLAHSSIGEAMVQDNGGMPCFSISDPNDGIEAITVYRLDKRPPSPVWKVLAATGHKLSYSSQGCISYGNKYQESTTQPEYTSSAAALTAGNIYEVVLTAPPVKSNDSTYLFKARFCVIQPIKQGISVVRQVRQDMNGSGWKTEICSTEDLAPRH